MREVEKKFLNKLHGATSDPLVRRAVRNSAKNKTDQDRKDVIILGYREIKKPISKLS